MSQHTNRHRLTITVMAVCLLTGSVLALTTKRIIAPMVTLKYAQERTYRIDKDFPEGAIEVIKVNNLNSTDFLEEMEIEVKNLSDKPIYYILVFGLLPKSKGLTGRLYALRLEYGDHRLISFQARPGENDKPILPGQSAILKVEKSMVSGYKEFLNKGSISIESLGDIEFFFQTITFGDGTGFIGRDRYPRANISFQVHTNQTEGLPPFSASFLPRNKKSKPSKTTARVNCHDCDFEIVDPGLGCHIYEFQSLPPCCGSNGCNRAGAVQSDYGPARKICQIWFCCTLGDCQGMWPAGQAFCCATDSLRGGCGSEGSVTCS